MRTSQNSAFILCVCVCVRACMYVCVCVCCGKFRTCNRTLIHQHVEISAWYTFYVVLNWLKYYNRLSILFHRFNPPAPWTFFLWGCMKYLRAPNLLLIIRTCITESLKLFRLWNPIGLNVPVFRLIVDWTWFVQSELFMRELIKKNPSVFSVCDSSRSKGRPVVIHLGVTVWFYLHYFKYTLYYKQFVNEVWGKSYAKRDLRFSRHCWWKLKSSGVRRRVARSGCRRFEGICFLRATLKVDVRNKTTHVVDITNVVGLVSIFYMLYLSQSKLVKAVVI
jgi:hypothetical protein